MIGDVRELLPLYALGILEPDESRMVERAVAGDAALAAELAAYQQTADALGAAIQPVPPPPDIKERLLASVGGGRFEKFAARMATLYDVTLERAREILGLIERPASWVAQMIPGISFVEFEGGPATAGADCGFVRIKPGTMFPPHTHIGDEVTVIFAGRLQDMANNRLLGPGDEYALPAGSTHYLLCIGDEDCIYASRAMDGISIGGMRITPTRN